MMNYEKAYKAVLQTATQWIKGGCTDKERICLECVFPELRESEDERIRKEIIDYFESRLSTAEEAEILYFKCWIAYLEKQKDASKAIEAVDRIDKYIDEHLANAHDMKDSNPDKKYYRGWDDALGKMAGILQDVYSDEKQKEQKPTWSEEETKDLVHILKVLDDCYAYGRHDLSKTDHDNLTSMIKSLPPSWKPSEEQIYTLERICSNLHLRASDDAPKLDEIIELLKQK